MSLEPQGGFAQAVDKLEETLMAFFLGAMTLVTFANVVARYVFNDNILWALEATVFMFAWLVLLGASYGAKKSLHLGVDILIMALAPKWRKVVGLIAVLACLVFSIMLLKGSWDYWYPFVTKRAFLETNDIPMPSFLQFLSVWLNEGEAYEKIPRFIPYAVLPVSMALLTLRFFQAGWRILIGAQDSIIASHEAEEMLAEVKASQNEKQTV
jgi:C4-dicarboxylate transporter, DctQ subunit